MAEVPRLAATRFIDTAASPSDDAIFTAASTIRSRLSPGLGPRPGRVRMPQAASMLAGRPGVPPSVVATSPALLRVGSRLTRSYYCVYLTHCSVRHTQKRGAGMADEWAIEARDLVKSYGSMRVLDGVELRAARGS